MPFRKFQISLIVLYLFGNSVLFNVINLLWESQQNNLERRKAKNCKIAVVLGGYSAYDPATDLFSLNDAGDRFLKGLGISLNRILLDKKARNTFENALLQRKFLIL